MRRLALAGAMAAISGLVVTAQAQGQVPPPPIVPLVFAGATFDVTGAGVLELGDLDAVLHPFRGRFGDGRERLGVEVTVDPAGAVVGCSTQGPQRLDGAGQALCAHALAHGRFVRNPILLLDYTVATYRLSIRGSRTKPAAGAPFFVTETGFPHEGEFVQFGAFDMPPEDQRLTLADVRMAALEYPAVALRNSIEARVVVLLTFSEAGQVATCRPLTSANSPRMAYETCFAARRATRLYRPPDARPFAFATRWMIGD